MDDVPFDSLLTLDANYIKTPFRLKDGGLGASSREMPGHLDFERRLSNVTFERVFIKLSHVDRRTNLVRTKV